jgi:hypothetical protein
VTFAGILPSPRSCQPPRFIIRDSQSQCRVAAAGAAGRVRDCSASCKSGRHNNNRD